MHNVTICAVIFGTDDSILNINLGEEFLFKKMSLIPSVDHLNEVFDTEAMGLRRDYDTAGVDDELNEICAYKTYQIELDNTEVEEYHNRVCNEPITYLDDKIRIIRLYSEGAIRFKRLSVVVDSGKTFMGDTEVRI